MPQVPVVESLTNGDGGWVRGMGDASFRRRAIQQRRISIRVPAGHLHRFLDAEDGQLTLRLADGDGLSLLRLLELEVLLSDGVFDPRQLLGWLGFLALGQQSGSPQGLPLASYHR